MSAVSIFLKSQNKILVNNMLKNCSFSTRRLGSSYMFKGTWNFYSSIGIRQKLPTIFGRNYMKSSPSREEKLRNGDGLPADYKLIYKAPMDYTVKVARGTSSITSLALICASIYAAAVENWDVRPIETDNVMETFIQNNEQLAMFIFGFLFINVAIQYVASQYALRIYVNGKDSYKCIFSDYLPWNTTMLTFTSGQAKFVGKHGILPWQESMYAIGTKKVLLIEDFFRAPADLATMLKTTS